MQYLVFWDRVWEDGVGSSSIFNLLESPGKSRAAQQQNQKPRKMTKLGDKVSPRYSGRFDEQEKLQIARRFSLGSMERCLERSS